METNHAEPGKFLYENQTKKLIGAIFKVYNQLGYGYQEKEYQSAYAEELTTLLLPFQREVYGFLKYNGKVIRKYFLDFLISFGDVKIIVELKVANDFYKKQFDQVLQYLKNNNLKLGLIFIITPQKVLVKRVIRELAASA